MTSQDHSQPTRARAIGGPSQPQPGGVSLRQWHVGSIVLTLGGQGGMLTIGDITIPLDQPTVSDLAWLIDQEDVRAALTSLARVGT